MRETGFLGFLYTNIGDGSSDGSNGSNGGGGGYGFMVRKCPPYYPPPMYKVLTRMPGLALAHPSGTESARKSAR